MSKLSDSDANRQVAALDGWVREGDAIRKQYTFSGFLPAMTFVNRVADAAERADHHPDILVNYRRVTLTFSTHSEGGLTMKDIDGAREADLLV